MDKLDKAQLLLLEKVRELNGLVQRIRKETTSVDVPGLMLVREDLGIRREKQKNVSHGQVYRDPKKSKAHMTHGQGEYTQSEISVS